MTEAVAVTPSTQVYDSALISSPVLAEVRELWRRRGLLGLLIRRDVSMRYKRSLLGIWWALLNPMLRMAVVWVVMAKLLRPSIPGGVPYVVYLFSGVILVTFFDQAVTSAGVSLVNGSAILSKVYAPPMCFALSAVGAALVTFLLSLIVLLVIMLLAGVGIPWTVVLLPAPFLALAAFATGIGLMLAALAVRFYDAIDITTVLMQIVWFATPIFYPLTIIPNPYRVLIELNPLTQMLSLERALAYEGWLGPWQIWVGSFAAGAVALSAGTYLFARSWKQSALML